MRLLSTLVVCWSLFAAVGDAQESGADLDSAIARGDVELARRLLEAGAHLQVDDTNGVVPLTIAARRRDAAMVRLLLEHGARVEVDDGNRRDLTYSLLAFTVAELPRELTRMLCAHAEDLDAPILVDELTPLQLAARAGRADVARDLLELGAAVDREHAGVTPLHVACLMGQREVVRSLVEGGAPFDRFAAIALDDPARLAVLLDADPTLAVTPDGLIGLGPVHWAASLGAAGCLELLLERDAPASEPPSPEGEADERHALLGRYRLAVRRTLPLQAAAEGGHRACVVLLLEHGANANAVDSDGETALGAACGTDDIEVVRALLAHGADANGADGQYRPPVGTAAARGKPELVRTLLDAGAAPHLGDRTGAAPLDLACTKAGLRIAREHAAEPPWDCHGAARVLLEHGAVPSFRAACVFGLEDALRAHLAREPELAERPFALVGIAHQGRPIEAAARSGAVASLAALHEAGVALVAPRGALQPLFLAADEGHAAAVAWLVDSGVPVDLRSLYGWTPLHEAAGGGSIEVVALLLARGADPNARTDFGETPLHAAAAGEAWERPARAALVERLLAAGCEVDARTQRGATPLHVATAGGRLDVAEPLLAAGADVNARDTAGLTPLRAAREGWGDQPGPAQRWAEVVELLQARGGVE